VLSTSRQYFAKKVCFQVTPENATTQNWHQMPDRPHQHSDKVGLVPLFCPLFLQSSSAHSYTHQRPLLVNSAKRRRTSKPATPSANTDSLCDVSKDYHCAPVTQLVYPIASRVQYHRIQIWQHDTNYPSQPRAQGQAFMHQCTEATTCNNIISKTIWLKKIQVYLYAWLA